MISMLLNLLALIIASGVVMILHELPKTILFFIIEKRKHMAREVMRLYQYIDPIGLIFCVAGYSGFSKSYVFHVKEKKTNLLLGITGLVTLFALFLAGVWGCKNGFLSIQSFLAVNDAETLILKVSPYVICQYIAIISLGMFIVNLFPAAAFDMGLLISRISPEKYFSILRNDYFIKMILVLAMILGIIRTMCLNGYLFVYKL